MKNYCIISHTHWDREWYLPFEQFRVKLCDLMDNLLDILKKDKGYRFHLDAQTIVLEDYLEIHPSRRKEIEEYVKEGRLLIGPWYVQNDFHLTSGESTVRNLIIGKRIAENFGKCMNVGYAADQFGICSQLPQILNGFDLDSCIFGRGYGRGETQFYWNSQDGSRVICEHMFGWYNNLQRLPEDPDAALKFIRERGGLCLERAKGNDALLMNGVDHLEAQENLTEILEGIQPLINGDEKVFQDTLPEYVDRLKATIAENGAVLKEYTGEMRDLGQNNILTGTLSSRLYLKQQNVRVQANIESRFEPTGAILDSLGIKKYPIDYSNYLWKTLIKNHPHDSICGCSVNAVHAHMEDRTARLEENLALLNRDAEDTYMKHLDRSTVADNAIFITCTNNNTKTYDGVFFADVNVLASEDKGGFTLADAKGRDIPFEVMEIDRKALMSVHSPINLPGIVEINRYKIAFRAGKVKGMTKKTLICTPTSNQLAVTENLKKRIRLMENEFLKVEINTDGSVNIYDKKSKTWYNNTLVIEDIADNGDLYIHGFTEPEKTVTSAGTKAKVELVRDTKLIKSRKISYTLKLDRSEEKTDMPIELILTLKTGSPILEVSATVENNAKFHLTRVLLPTGIESDVNYSGQPFDVIERTKISPWNEDENHPNTNFVGIDGEGHGIAILNEGLFEYEHKTDAENTLALAIHRSVEAISPLMADAQTDSGQCIGKNTVRFAIYPYSGNHVEAGVVNIANEFLSAPYTHVQHNDYNKFAGGRPFVQTSGIPESFARPLEHPEIVLPLENTFFSLDESIPNAIILSAYKGVEDGEGRILRFYNSTDKTVDFTLTFSHKIGGAYLTSLNEDIRESLKVKGGKKITLSAGPKEIITIKTV